MNTLQQKLIKRTKHKAHLKLLKKLEREEKAHNKVYYQGGYAYKKSDIHLVDEYKNARIKRVLKVISIQKSLKLRRALEPLVRSGRMLLKGGEFSI